MKLLLAAGANPNAKAGDGSTPLHQAVQAQQVAMIRALATRVLRSTRSIRTISLRWRLAEKLKNGPPEPVSVMGDPGAYRPKRDSREDVVAALRDLMHLGPNDPVASLRLRRFNPPK